MEKTNSNETVSLKIQEHGTKENVALVAYVVDKLGTLIESAPVENGTVSLGHRRSTIDSHGYKIYIAQAFPKELEKKINERLLVKAGAYAVVHNFMGNEISIAHLPSTVYEPCRIEFCHIRGNITNNVLINGAEVNAPVNKARVHIQNVDRRLRWPLYPIIYDQIPDWVINEIRNEFINLPPVESIDAATIEDKIESATSFKAGANRNSLKKHPLTPIPDDVMQGILSTSRETVLQTLAENHDILIPYFCWWEWCWPWFYYLIDETVVYTDCNGNFDALELILSCYTPNIRIWVDLFLNGSWVTVYNPWFPCNIHWAYHCGTAININLGDLNILPCGSTATLAGESVYLNSINGGATIRSVQQSATSSGHLANAVGLTAYGGDGNISPFGSALSFWVQFGVNLYGATFAGKKITNYRWRYAQLKDAYLQTPVAPVSGILSAAVSIPYYYYVPSQSGTGFDETINNFQLGPFMDASNNPMYIIPQSSPTHTYSSLPTGANNPVIPANAQFPAWYTPYPLTDSISFDSTAFPNGLYEFTLELLDATGTVVPVPTGADHPFLINSVSTDNNPTNATMINADGLSQNGYAENYVKHDGAGNATGFNFQMRIDNTPCYSGISSPVVNNMVAPPCGIANYNHATDPVELTFQAGHPHNFATYGFDVYIGDMGLVEGANNPLSSGTSANQNRTSPAPVTSGDNGYSISQVSALPILSTNPPNPENQVPNMDQYQKTLAVSDMFMLGVNNPSGCTAAAFSQNLGVYATHTNGVSRLNNLDAYCVTAFALTQTPVPCPEL